MSAFAAPATKEIAGTIYKHSMCTNGDCSQLARKKHIMMMSRITSVIPTVQMEFNSVHMHDTFDMACNLVRCNPV